jgi:hypothetical protein
LPFFAGVPAGSGIPASVEFRSFEPSTLLGIPLSRNSRDVASITSALALPRAPTVCDAIRTEKLLPEELERSPHSQHASFEN